MTTVAVIVASTRPGRVGPVIAQWFLSRAAAHEGLDVELVDLADVGLPLLEEPEHPSSGHYVHEHTRRWATTVASADAFVLVTPEYNSGMPAPLKNALDHLYWEWAYKPVGFLSYGMSSSGLRSVAMLRQIVSALRMVPVSADIAVPLRNRLDDAGALQPTKSMDSAVDTMLEELVRVSAALRPLRTPEPAVEGAA